MRLFRAVVGYVFAHSRVQFHPAAWALVYAVIFITLMIPCLFILSLIFEAFGSAGVTLDYETNAILYGPVLFGELVRGHVRTWLGYRPEEWCFPAIAVAGLATGGVFGTFMALRWEELPSIVPLGWGAGVAAFYLLIGWLLRLEERKHRVSVR